MSDLHRRGKLWLQIVSLQAGSVVVKLRVTVQDPEFPVGISTLAPMLPRLWESTVFQIDRTGTLVQGRSPPHALSVLPRHALTSVVFRANIDFIPKER